MIKELVRKCPTNVFRILNNPSYEIDNHLVGNKYVAHHHSEVFATMLEVENEENLSKLGLLNSVSYNII